MAALSHMSTSAVDEADPDTVAGWVFQLLCDQDTDQYESCDGYEYREPA